MYFFRTNHISKKIFSFFLILVTSSCIKKPSRNEIGDQSKPSKEDLKNHPGFGLIDMPTTSVIASQAATGASAALLLYIVALSDLFGEKSVSGETAVKRAFYADSDWYKEFVKMSPEKKKIVIERQASIVKELLGGKKIDLAISWIGGGHGHMSARDGVKNAINMIPGWKDIFEIKDYRLSTSGRYRYEDMWAEVMATGDRERMKNILNGTDAEWEEIGKQNWREFGSINSFKEEVEQVRKLYDGRSPDFIVTVHNATLLYHQQRLGQVLDADMRSIPTDYDIRHFFGKSSAGILAPDVRIDLPGDTGTDSPSRKRLKELGLKNVELTGYAVRWPFLYQAQRQYSSDENVRKAVEVDIDAFYQAKGVKPGDKSILVMLGGAGSSNEVLKKYVQKVAENVEKISASGEKVHMFVASSPEQNRFLDNVQIELEKKGISRSKFELKPQGRISADNIAKFMSRSLCIVKPGGSTTAELVTTRAKALFDMTISDVLPWEKEHAEWFERNKWGRKMPESDSPDDFVKAINTTFNQKPTVEFPKNQFNLDWVAQILYASQTRITAKSGVSIRGKDVLEVQKKFLDPDISSEWAKKQSFNKLVKPPLSTTIVIKNTMKGIGAAAVGAAVGVGVGTAVEELKKHKERKGGLLD
ncbi:MAG: hypothetical protein HRU09_15310 [Oligoflexales bacterium]|nr:hypothetical protein [Oligoflexales bacterium]